MNRFKANNDINCNSLSSRLLNSDLVSDGLEQLEDLLDRYIDLIIEITQIPAPTFQEDDRAEFVRKTMQEYEFPVVKKDPAGNILGFFPGKDASRTIISMAHMDTVFPKDTKIDITKNDEIIAAPGVGDNSTSVASLLILGKILTSHLPLEHPLIFIGTVGEEGLGDLKGSKYFCENWSEYDFDGFQLDQDSLTFLNIDGNLGRIVNGGVLSTRLQVNMTGEGGHSWKDFGSSSAVHALGSAIAQIAKLDVPKDPKTTYNVGTVNGGTSINTIAEEAEMLIDMRSMSEEELSKLEKKVSNICEKSAEETSTSYEKNLVGKRPGGYLSEESDMVQGLLKLTKEQGYKDVEICPASTDSNIPLSKGWPAVTMGFKKSKNTHKKDEYLILNSLLPGIKLELLCFAGLLEDVL